MLATRLAFSTKFGERIGNDQACSSDGVGAVGRTVWAWSWNLDKRGVSNPWVFRNFAEGVLFLHVVFYI